MPRSGTAAILCAALGAALAVGACDDGARRKAEGAAADAAVNPKPPPLRFSLSTPDAKVELTLPPGIAAYPDLHRMLFENGRDELLEFAKAAADDRRRLASKGVSQPTPYVRRVSWTLTAVTPDLVSLKGHWFDDTGGIHPDQGSQARLWDRARKQVLATSDLFRDDADQPALDEALCKAVTRVKTARMGPTDPDSWSCPKWSDSQAVLAPSARPRRAGGLTFLFDPYVIGPYAEGDYEVLIPLSDFQAALAPAWAKDFEGTPALAAAAHPVAKPAGSR
jgi:hypothetical protein